MTTTHHTEKGTPMTTNSTHVRPRSVERWETVAVIPAPPGLRNYFDDDGTEVSCPCIAFLLQEHRCTERLWDVPRTDGKWDLGGRTDHHTEPYDTRVVAADLADGELEPVTDVSNYLRTMDSTEAVYYPAARRTTGTKR